MQALGLIPSDTKNQNEIKAREDLSVGDFVIEDLGEVTRHLCVSHNLQRV